MVDAEAEPGAFRELLKEVAERDGLTVLRWCLMPNHYHLAVRVGVVRLERQLKSLRQRVARFVNRGSRVYGPLWQGRYRAKLVTDERYFQQLLAYIHLNPVSGGMVEDPARLDRGASLLAYAGDRPCHRIDSLTTGSNLDTFTGCGWTFLGGGPSPVGGLRPGAGGSSMEFFRTLGAVRRILRA